VIALLGARGSSSAADESHGTSASYEARSFAAALSPAASCSDAARWAESVVLSDFSTLEAISSLPIVYRRAVYARLSESERVGLWRAQFDQERQQTAMSAVQRAYLAAVSDSLVEFFAADSVSRVELARRLHQTSVELFGAERAFRLFAQLGPPDENVKTGDADVLPPLCTCSTVDPWCGGGNSCKGGGCETDWGCGSLWAFTCNGMCYRGVQ
jgi:hypothetical protein